MNKKKMVATIIILIVGILLIWLMISNNGYDNQEMTNDEQQIGTDIGVKSNNTITNQTNNTTNNTNQTRIITLEELKMHDEQKDCWVGYQGKVYDITKFLPNHPGTAARIAPYCGSEKEFTQAFTQQHGTTKAKMLVRVGQIMGDFEVKGTTQ